ncbi:MAG: hypothetical protein M1827_005226 [Pycnora praestabilis]|nr:MAG: hypothetical protein M1827_005226 [Pycnora praestabilis]
MDRIYSRWLVSSIACCAPLLEHDEKRSESRERTMKICHDQPQLIKPPNVNAYDGQAHDTSSHPYPQLIVGSQPLASRASSRTSFSVRRPKTTESRRPTISAPSDFRQVEKFSTTRDNGGFRPLELSIYLPENKLSPLPTFSEESNKPLGLEYPQQVLFRSRTDSLLSITSTFRIPRKPVPSLSGSRPHSFDMLSMSSRPSVDLADNTLRTRPSLPDSLGTRELIDKLEVRLPKTPTPLLIRSQTEPIHILQRRETMQLKSVPTPSNERHDGESRLYRIETIMEERPIGAESESSDISVPPPVPSKTQPSRISQKYFGITEAVSPMRIPVRSATFSDIRSIFHRATPADSSKQLPPTPSSPIVEELDIRPSESNLDVAPPAVPPKSTSRRSRVSQWFFPVPTTDAITSTTQEDFDTCSGLESSSRTSTTTNSSGALIEEDTVSALTITPASSPSRSSATRPGSYHERGQVGGVVRKRDPLPPYQACPAYEEVDPHPKGFSSNPVAVVAC